MRLFVLSLALFAAALTGAGCASTDDELRRALKAERDEELSLVSRQDLARFSPGSPERAVMTLWRAIQFRDAKAAVALLVPRPTGPQLPKVESFLAGQAARGAVTSKLVPKRTTRSGDRAVAHVEIVGRKKVGTRVTASVTGQLRFDLIREASGWKVRWLEFVRRFTKGQLDVEPPDPTAPGPTPSVRLDSRENPKQAALSWWSALRDGDPAAVTDGLTPAARSLLDVAATTGAVNGKLGRWARGTTAKVLYAEGSGARATVFMEVEGGHRIGDVVAKTGVLMLALPLLESNGRWRVDDSAWLRQQVKAYQRG